MNGFDPTRVLTLAKVIESGSESEKIDLLNGLDPKDPIASGVLMRAAIDPLAAVRRRALERMAEAGIRPVDDVLERLARDEDEGVRQLATELKNRPDALNPLEQLIPQIEQMAGSLGPLGALLKGMIESLRGMADDNEREQLVALARLDASNPAASVAVQQALQSAHISVRLQALKKTLQLDGVLVSEAQITEFLTDPSPDVRAAAQAVVDAGKVGTMSEEAFRAAMMESVMKSMLGAAGLGGMAGLDLGALFGGLAGGGQAGADAEPDAETDADAGAEPEAAGGAPAHVFDGWIYFVGDARVRERMASALVRLASGAAEPAWERLERGAAPQRWAVRPVAAPPGRRPAWADLLAGAGLSLAEETLARAEQARHLSQQVWGAAYAEHGAERALTLVFHDGVLSRAEWGGRSSGSWSQAGAGAPGAGGPDALLNAFLTDPTDDRLPADHPAPPLRTAERSAPRS